MKVVVAYGAFALLLIEAAGNILPTLGVSDSVNRVMIWSALAGLPLAIILAWKFDVIADRGASAHPREPEDLDLPDGRVAVLPFRDMSEGRTDEYFADGVTEDIIAKLAQVPTFSVVSCTSVMGFRGTQRPIASIGRELGAGSIVEGSVRRAGGRVRVVAQLIDANTDRSIWTETYDREVDDLFSVQSDIAACVARGLRASLSNEDVARLTAPHSGGAEAYDLYLQARHLWNTRSVSGLHESRALLERAIQRDPELALAHAGLASTLATSALYNLDPPPEVMPRSLEASAQALTLEPNLVEALNAQGLVECIWQWDWARGAATFARAAEVSPSDVVARQWYALNCLAPRGRVSEAMEALELASSLDPLSPIVQISDGFLKYLARDLEGAEKALRPVLDEAACPPVAHLFMGFVHELAGQHELARHQFRTAEAVGGSTVEALAALGTNRALAGDEEGARGILEELVAIGERRYVSPGRLAQVSAALGDWEQARAHWKEAIRIRSADLIWVGVSPVYDFAEGRAELREVTEAVGAVE